MVIFPFDVECPGSDLGGAAGGPILDARFCDVSDGSDEVGIDLPHRSLPAELAGRFEAAPNRSQPPVGEIGKGRVAPLFGVEPGHFLAYIFQPAAGQFFVIRFQAFLHLPLPAREDAVEDTACARPIEAGDIGFFKNLARWDRFHGERTLAGCK